MGSDQSGTIHKACLSTYILILDLSDKSDFAILTKEEEDMCKVSLQALCEQEKAFYTFCFWVETCRTSWK